jgi:hypothetical protein
VRADDLAVRLTLVAHFDLPGGIVRDDDQQRHAVPHGRIDLHRVEAEGAVAGQHRHRSVGAARAAAMPNGVPMPMQPSEPGSRYVFAGMPTRAKLRKFRRPR